MPSVFEHEQHYINVKIHLRSMISGYQHFELHPEEGSHFNQVLQTCTGEAS